MDGLDELQSEELKDFLTSFKFPWEEAASSRSGRERDPRRRSSRRHTLSDTTPARRRRPLSGKVLSEDFSEDLGNWVERPDVAKEEFTSDTQSSDCSENPSEGPCSSDEGLPVDSFQRVLERGFDLAVNEGSSTRGKSKKKRRQSSVFKKSESLALLKTIGEILSPNSPRTSSGNIVLTPLSQPVEGIQSQRKTTSNTISNDVKPTKREKKTRSSRRSSRRLSGIGGPMLELGANGIPKLLKLEQVFCPEVCGSPGDSPNKEGVDGLAQDICIQGPDYLTPMETETVRGSASIVTPEEKTCLSYRMNNQSPMTPLIVLTPASPEDDEYLTPQGPTVFKEPSHTTYTPDNAMIGSLQHLRLHPELVKSCELGDSALGAHTSSRSLNNGEAGETPCLERDIPCLEKASDLRELGKLDPDSTHEEFASPMTSFLNKDSDEFEMEDGNSFNKENQFISREDDTLLDLFDAKVKDLYLKKGKVGPTKSNTNLETVFEEPSRRNAGIGRRKFKRVLAFPEKPWEARKGTKGRKIRKKRYSLSRTAKKNDPILQERLNLVLNSIAEDSC